MMHPFMKSLREVPLKVIYCDLQDTWLILWDAGDQTQLYTKSEVVSVMFKLVQLNVF